MTKRKRKKQIKRAERLGEPISFKGGLMAYLKYIGKTECNKEESPFWKITCN